MEICELDRKKKMTISVSEPRNGQLRIFGAWDNDDYGPGCQIMVCRFNLTNGIVIDIYISRCLNCQFDIE